MKTLLHERVARYGGALYLLVPLYLLTLAFWKMPSLALAAGASLATIALFAFMQELLRSPERARQWHHAVVVIGRVTSIVVPLAVLVGGAGAIWICYPFRPIFDVPFAQLTLDVVLVDLFGVALFAIIPNAFREAFSKALRADLHGAGQFGLSLATFASAVLIVYRQTS